MDAVATIRDLAIILLALESLAIGILMVVLLFQLRSLIRLVEEEIRPLLDSANQTVGTVRGTTAFVSDHLVKPVVKVASFFAGARRALEVLANLGEEEK